jgi:hypothetical protein
MNSTIVNNLALSELLCNMVITQGRMTNDIYNDIMAFVLDKDAKHADDLHKWIMNCNKLVGKLNETQ